MSETQQAFYRVQLTKAILESMANDTGGTRSVDVTNLVQYYEFSESLFSPTIHGKIIIFDGVGLLNNETFTITGEEFLTVGIETAEDKSFEYKFVISNIDIESKSESGDSAIIVLTLLSIDDFSNLFTFKSKSYRDSTITDIVRSILITELGTQIKIEDERFIQSTGPRTFAFTKIRPLEKIQILKQQAFEQGDTLSSTYVFYQDREGYNFKPIERIIESSKANTEPLTYQYSQQGSYISFIQPNRRLIRQLVPSSRMSNYSRLVSGFYNTTVKRFDFIHKRVTEEKFNAHDDAKKFAHMIGGEGDRNAYTLNVSEAFAQRVASVSDYTCLIPWNSDINDLTYKNIVFSKPFIQLLSENTLEVVVDGTLAFDLGDPLEIEVSDNRPTETPEKGIDPRYSGRYFVASMHHSVTLDSIGEFRYECSLQLTRDLLPISQEIYNQQSPGEFDIPVLQEGGYV